MRFYDRVADAKADIPDRKDLVYRPSLGSARANLDPRVGESAWWLASRVRDQGDDPSCTGHALAAAVDAILAIEHLQADGISRSYPTLKRLEKPYSSAFMLYGNAKLHDEWDGEGYSGSSIRGALKGFHNNGLCSIETASALINSLNLDPSSDKWRWYTNREVRKEASQLMLGAYYRVPLILTDMHSAIQESGVLLATAAMHPGWQTPSEDGIIEFDPHEPTENGSYHAFLIVGYNEQGWLIQNSWGRDWGQDGIALWRYADWATNATDVWAIRLSAQVADGIRHSYNTRTTSLVSLREQTSQQREPTRLDVLGHLLPIEDSRLVRYGRYHHDIPTLLETIEIIKREIPRLSGEKLKKTDPQAYRYQHLLIHSLGGGRDETENARMVRALNPIYRANGIYPIFLQWEEPVWQDLGHQMVEQIDAIHQRYEANAALLDKRIARLIEVEAAGVPARYWENLERSIEKIFVSTKTADGDDQTIHRSPAEGAQFFSVLFDALGARHQNRTMSFHISGHDLGAIFTAEFFAKSAFIKCKKPPVFSSLHMISALIDQDRFEQSILDYLAYQDDGIVNRRARRDSMIIEHAKFWTLEQRHLDRDRFHRGYDYSWPEYWARVRGIASAKKDPADPTLDPEKDGSAVFHIRKMLALPKYCDELSDKLLDKKYSVSRHFVDRDIDGHAPSHKGLDSVPEVVNGMIEGIVGPENVRRKMGIADWVMAQ